MCVCACLCVYFITAVARSCEAIKQTNKHDRVTPVRRQLTTSVISPGSCLTRVLRQPCTGCWAGSSAPRCARNRDTTGGACRWCFQRQSQPPEPTASIHTYEYEAEESSKCSRKTGGRKAVPSGGSVNELSVSEKRYETQLDAAIVLQRHLVHIAGAVRVVNNFPTNSAERLSDRV